MQILVDIGLPLATAGVVMLLIAAWGRAGPGRVSIGWALAVALGIFAGQWATAGLTEQPMATLTGLRGLPKAPFETMDWVVAALLPATVVTVALWFGGRRLRIAGAVLAVVIAVGLAPLLMMPYVTGQVEDWSLATRIASFALLTLAIGGVWRSLTVLEQRRPGRSLPLALAGVAGGYAAMIMLSDSLSSGRDALTLMGATLGAIGASFAMPRAVVARGSATVPWLVLAALLIQGRFFVAMEPNDLKFLPIAAAPLLAWAGEDPWCRRLGPARRGLVRIGVVAVPLAVAILVALAEFWQASAEPSPYG